ncbi:hypothetical protein C7974DRAFT_424928 [Boeremia exigua]|uniref:uncharacterized protein n=1 Tax=Boeremia exigua TaxID=749465 RepID=UPI001E8CB6B3|nr:uncharacterized protein C7974DRAFT_424928 [Boeremia exigua]KAH6625226.1 hypothetical protein C7974DRAFT_424928 [Boeremia exigua]
MRFNITFAIVLSMLAAVIAMPTSGVKIESLNFPTTAFASMLETHSFKSPIACPAGEGNCGVVTFESGQYVTFGQGTCMQLSGKVQSIYVAKCFCSLWTSCTGNAETDIFVDGMMMCEKPRTMDTFAKKVKYISCGGMN